MEKRLLSEGDRILMITGFIKEYWLDQITGGLVILFQKPVRAGLLSQGLLQE